MRLEEKTKSSKGIQTSKAPEAEPASPTDKPKPNNQGSNLGPKNTSASGPGRGSFSAHEAHALAIKAGLISHAEPVADYYPVPDGYLMSDLGSIFKHEKAADKRLDQEWETYFDSWFNDSFKEKYWSPTSKPKPIIRIWIRRAAALGFLRYLNMGFDYETPEEREAKRIQAEKQRRQVEKQRRLEVKRAELEAEAQERAKKERNRVIMNDPLVLAFLRRQGFGEGLEFSLNDEESVRDCLKVNRFDSLDGSLDGSLEGLFRHVHKKRNLKLPE